MSISTWTKLLQKHGSFVLLVHSIVTYRFYFPDPLYQLFDLGFYLFFSTLNTNLVHFVGQDYETKKVFYLGNWEDMLHVHIYVMMVFNEIFTIFWSYMYAFNPCVFFCIGLASEVMAVVDTKTVNL